MPSEGLAARDPDAPDHPQCQGRQRRAFRCRRAVGAPWSARRRRSASRLASNEPSAGIRARAAEAGFYESPWGKHRRLDLRAIGQLPDGMRIDSRMSPGPTGPCGERNPRNDAGRVNRHAIGPVRSQVALDGRYKVEWTPERERERGQSVAAFETAECFAFGGARLIGLPRSSSLLRRRGRQTAPPISAVMRRIAAVAAMTAVALTLVWPGEALACNPNRADNYLHYYHAALGSVVFRGRLDRRGVAD